MSTELQSVAEIFNNRIFRIPDYQRGYAWGEQQLADFWSDLRRVGSERTHYCGQLTLEKVVSDGGLEWGGDEWLVKDAGFVPHFVVDGQQRLTTAIILIHCLLKGLPPEERITGLKVSELRERYLSRSQGVLHSCIFGYAKDNPSHEFFRTQILGVPSNDYSGVRTTYTANLAFARDYFRDRTAAVKGSGDREQLFKALTQRFRFNIHELNDDIDVFVAFETMNNRGKLLSRLELLKNRLIYLSTLAKANDSERMAVRRTLNAVWRTVYEELGRNPNRSLDDDDLLRAHWIVFFGYDKDEADPLTQFLLNKHFTTGRLDQGELTLGNIQEYAGSLQVSARVWQQLHFPESHAVQLGDSVSRALIRLNRLGFGPLRPLLLAALSHEQKNGDFKALLFQAERFLLLVRNFAGTRANVAEAESFRMAHDLHQGRAGISQAVDMLRDRVTRHFSPAAFSLEISDLFGNGGKGFSDIAGLKFLLFEYEENLRRAGKAAASKIAWDDFHGSRNSIEHIYPQDPKPGDWPEFEAFTDAQKHVLRHSLGNLVAVSVAKNASLSRRSFNDKKRGTDQIPGYSQGSFSELKIAQVQDWTALEILNRGIELLTFIENQWEITLGDEKFKRSLLSLQFL